MRSDSGFGRSLRRFRIGSTRPALKARLQSKLPFVGDLATSPKLLLDTTVYIDKLQGRLSATVNEVMDSADIWHSTVTECELAMLAGLLNPAHPDSANALEELMTSIEGRRAHRVLNPDRTIWREAGILAGLLARLQQYGNADRRRALNDALIFLSAAKSGLTVLTRNVSDYDLLMQLAPYGQAVFYNLDPRSDR